MTDWAFYADSGYGAAQQCCTAHWCKAQRENIAIAPQKPWATGSTKSNMSQVCDLKGLAQVSPELSANVQLSTERYGRPSAITTPVTAAVLFVQTELVIDTVLF